MWKIDLSKQGRFWPGMRYARGATLLDELAAVVVLSVGLLGLAGVQGRATSVAATSENLALALTLAQSQIERLRGQAAEPLAAGGYGRIASSSETIGAIGEQHLERPFARRTYVTRFALREGQDHGGPRYEAVPDEMAQDPDVPEFKRITVSVAWVDKTGSPHQVVIPGIVSPGAF